MSHVIPWTLGTSETVCGSPGHPSNVVKVYLCSKVFLIRQEVIWLDGSRLAAPSTERYACSCYTTYCCSTCDKWYITLTWNTVQIFIYTHSIWHRFAIQIHALHTTKRTWQLHVHVPTSTERERERVSRIYTTSLPEHCISKWAIKLSQKVNPQPKKPLGSL